MGYEELQDARVKMWVTGVPVEEGAKDQLKRVASLPFIYKWVAAMPDVHWGMGATVGSVIPTKGAIIPAAVGVDIGCGMLAARTSLKAPELPKDLYKIRTAIESAVPHGRGSWQELPKDVKDCWEQELSKDFQAICAKHPKIKESNNLAHLGTLGSGNHFIEVCLDKESSVWIMLHSGSRGVGNKIGSYFISLARKEMNQNLAYFSESSPYFQDYLKAVDWAQRFAYNNRKLMFNRVCAVLREVSPYELITPMVDCHHNYVQLEEHYGEKIFVTRKGAVRACKGDLGIIPGSMGAKSFIVEGKGNPESFCSCSHGAGRAMSRKEAKARFSEKDHAKATFGVECRKDSGVLDETPQAYKDIDLVMAAQSDLVEIKHELRQVICVKG